MKSSLLKWVVAIALLIVATVATGGLDLPAILLAGSAFLYFRDVTK